MLRLDDALWTPVPALLRVGYINIQETLLHAPGFCASGTQNPEGRTGAVATLLLTCCTHLAPSFTHLATVGVKPGVSHPQIDLQQEKGGVHGFAQCTPPPEPPRLPPRTVLYTPGGADGCMESLGCNKDSRV